MKTKKQAVPRQRRSAVPMEESAVDPLFEAVASSLLAGSNVTRARMFGSHGLKVTGRVFAMLVKKRLVVKLPRGRVEDLVRSGQGEPFDPGHGRLMKEWVSIGAKSKAAWAELASEARDFVSNSR